ncbi:MAG: hypothetical protein ACOCP4_05495 [Candidatus Woesearchaeota archaeon]
MSELEVIELKNKENKSKTEKDIVQSSDLFLDRLRELKTENPTEGWTKIARILSNEFNMKVNPKTIENKYLEETSMEIQVEGYAEKQFGQHVTRLAKRYEQTEKLADKFLKAMNNIVDLLSEVDENNLGNLSQVIKLIKPYESLNRALMSQLQFVRDEQDKILMKLNKNKKEMSDEDIRVKTMEIHKELLDLQERQGKIKIYDRSILK